MPLLNVTIERKLGALERQFYQQNLVGSTHMCAYLRFEGTIDPSRLREANRSLVKRYPLLTALIASDPYLRFSLEQSLPEIPSQTIERESLDHWRRLMENEFSRRFLPGQGQSFLNILEDDQGFDFLLTVNHSVADGLSLNILCHALLAFYNDPYLAQSAAASLGPVEPRFPKAYRGFQGWWKALRFIFTLAKLGPALQIGSTNITVNTLSDGFTFLHSHELNRLAREKGCNLFAAFSAVVLQSLFEIYGQQANESLSLNTPVSLRPKIEHSPEEIGVFIAGHMALYQISADTDVWELARNCFETLRRGIEEDRPFLLTLLAGGAKKPKSPKISPKPSKHRPTVSISNLGRAEPFAKLPDARVLDHRMVAAQSAKDPFAFTLISYDGRLNIDLQSSQEKIGREAARKILYTVEKNLHQLVNFL